jgi:hypothetical protein
MAEIRVEPRRGGRLGWVWALVVVVVLAALAWYFLYYRQDPVADGLGRLEERAAPAAVALTAAPPPGARATA